MISHADSSVALEYAESHLSEEKNEMLADRLASYLAMYGDANNTLDTWLSKQRQAEVASKNYIEIADATSSRLQSIIFNGKNDRDKAIERVASLMVEGILRGAKLSTCSAIHNGEDICFRYERSSITVEHPSSIFGNNDVLNALFRRANIKKMPPETFFRSLTTVSDRGIILGIRLHLGKSSLIGENFGKIDSDTTDGSILIAMDGNDEKGKLGISFRSASGKWVHDSIKDFSGIYSAMPEFAFDEAFMQQSEMRRYKLELEN